MNPTEILAVPHALLANIDSAWTFLLLMARYSALMVLLPGIGMGERGLITRFPAIIVLSAASMLSSPKATIPSDIVLMGAALTSEYIFGTILGLIPKFLISGIHNAMQLASTTMGLGMGNLIDPTLGVQSSDISRIVGDICIVLFLLLGGHYVIIHAAAGLGGTLVPGTFILNEYSLDLVIDRSAAIFETGVILAAPVLVALMLTNFVMGVITKAVPTVNIFIVSFPLTIGIGLILTVLALPDITTVFKRQVLSIESQVVDVAHGNKILPSAAVTPAAGQAFDTTRQKSPAPRTP